MQEEHINKRFDSLEERFGSMEKRFGALETMVEDVLIAVNTFATQVQVEFTEIRSDVAGINSRLDRVEGRLDKVEGTLATRMVTKDYLDEKLFDLKGELFSRSKKENQPFMVLVDILTTKKILTKTEKRRISALSPVGRV